MLFSNKPVCDELQFHNLKGEQKSQPDSKQTTNNSDLKYRFFFFRFDKTGSIALRLIHALSGETAYKCR